MTNGDEPINAREWCKDIIEGSGGMNDYESREVIAWQDSDRVCGAHWALRCLANPRCSGSQKVLDEILEARGAFRPAAEVPISEEDLAALRRDAERYRKLRALHWSDYKLTVTNGDSVMLGHVTYGGDRLDAAIDSLTQPMESEAAT